MGQRTLLITGGAGMLATEISRYFAHGKDYRVVSLAHGDFEVASDRDVRSAMTAHRPDVVVNTAAVHVDDSESDPETAFRINAWAVRGLARACQEHDAAFVHVSTCGLFGDEIRAYHEYDPVALKTVYARSKHAGEEYVRSSCERHFILRLGWLYGGGVGHRKNFVVARMREGREKTSVQSAGDKHGSPTFAGDVASLIAPLVDSGQFGLYHVANGGGGTRAEYVREIFRGFGLDTPVEDVDSSHFPRKAQVPDSEMLTSMNLPFAGLPELPQWREALDRYIRSIRDEVPQI